MRSCGVCGGGQAALFLPAEDRARSRSQKTERALSMYIYIQETVFLPAEDRARALALSVYITFIILKYMRVFVPSGKTNDNLSYLGHFLARAPPFSAATVCMCVLCVCIRFCLEKHVAPKGDQTGVWRVRAGSAATHAALPCAHGRACGARTHTRWRLLWAQYATFTLDVRRPLRPGLPAATCASACLLPTAAAAATGLCGRGDASHAKMQT